MIVVTAETVKETKPCSHSALRFVPGQDGRVGAAGGSTEGGAQRDGWPGQVAAGAGGESAGSGGRGALAGGQSEQTQHRTPAAAPGIHPSQCRPHASGLESV